MKTYAALACLIILNLNCQEMNNDTECFNIKNFNLLKTRIIENDTEIKLHERLVADKEIVSKELSTNDRYIELVENSNFDEIIVIDKNNKIPPYSCTIEGNNLSMSAYESRFDTDLDIKTRRNDWCNLISEFVSKE